jgi:hypothetical protein
MALQLELARGARLLGEDFKGSQDAISTWASEVSKATFTSVEDQAKAFYIANKILRDDAQAREVSRLAALESISTGKDLATVVENFSNIVKTLGITSISKTIDTLNMLSFANAKSSLSWEQFMNLVLETAPKIKDKVDFTDWITGISALSNQSGITAEMVVSSFSEMADAIENPADKMNMLLGKFGSIQERINKEGVIGALEDISKRVQSSGILATELAQAYGLGAQTILLLKSASEKTFESTKIGQEKTIEGMKTIEERTENNISATERLLATWNRFKSTVVGSSEVITFLDLIDTNLQNITDNIEKSNSAILGLGKSFLKGLGGFASMYISKEGINDPINRLISSIQSANESFKTSDLLGHRLELNKLLLGSLGQTGLQTFIRRGTEAGLSLSDLVKGVRGEMTANFQNTFNITTPPGGEQLTSQRIVEQLKSQFYGL